MPLTLSKIFLFLNEKSQTKTGPFFGRPIRNQSLEIFYNKNLLNNLHNLIISFSISEFNLMKEDD